MAYLRALALEDSIGSYDRREVLVLADSGYDDKKIEKAIANKGWNFIIALGATRSVTSEALSLTTPTSQQWGSWPKFVKPRRSGIISEVSVSPSLGWHLSLIKEGPRCC